MKLPRLRTVLLAPFALFAFLYVAVAIKLAVDDDSLAIATEGRSSHETVAILGASGTAGDGILKAALANPDIEKIHVITRRATPRIEEGVAAGKVEITLHMDYLDYSVVRDKIAEADAVFWAIGTSSFGVVVRIEKRVTPPFTPCATSRRSRSSVEGRGSEPGRPSQV